MPSISQQINEENSDQQKKMQAYEYEINNAISNADQLDRNHDDRE